MEKKEKRMTQKEKLIELIREFGLSGYEIKDLSDYLLANGVVVLPCKVGDIVYVPHIEHHCTNNKCFCCETVQEVADKACDFHEIGKAIFEENFKLEMLDSVGKTVFLTREEAKAALEKLLEK